MSQYNWTRRYDVPEVYSKRQKNSYQSRGFDTKLRQTIDVASLRSDNFNTKKEKIDPSFQSLRQTTSHNITLSNLLGKPYKYFEPRTNRPKGDSFRNTPYEEYNPDNVRRHKPYQSSVNSSWGEGRFKSLKDLGESQKQPSYTFNRRQKLWNSTRLIPSTESIYQVKTPNRIKDPQQSQSPYTFIKKNKILQMTPQSSKQESDETSTRVGSEISLKMGGQTFVKVGSQTLIKIESSVSSCQTETKLFKLKIIQQKQIQPPTLDDFFTIKHLGEGRFGTVSMAIHKRTGFLVAIKRVKKAVIKTHKLQNQFTMEMKMQLYLNHPNILKLYGYFDDAESIYLILQFMQEGTLFSKLKKEKEKHFDQKTASQKMDDVIHAIKYMHSLEVAHRDIKPQNIVISNGICKLCDFGWAAFCENRRTTLCGTIDYAPPEVLEGKEYGISMDLWCLGVLCYELIVGKAPFYHVSRKQTMQKIINADANELKLPEHLSKQAADFISKMLIKDPEERMLAEDALHHEFIVKHVQKDNEKLRGNYR